MTTGEANRNPRRWMDQSARVRVIEGWHPSRPDRLGYNLVVDGDWIGTFDSLDNAAREATARLRSGSSRTADPHVVLLPCIHS